MRDDNLRCYPPIICAPVEHGNNNNTYTSPIKQLNNHTTIKADIAPNDVGSSSTGEGARRSSNDIIAERINRCGNEQRCVGVMQHSVSTLLYVVACAN